VVDERLAARVAGHERELVPGGKWHTVMARPSSRVVARIGRGLAFGQVETALMLRLTFHLPLRQTEGFMESIFALLDVTMVSAFAARLVLGQVKVNEKSNEIVAITTLLDMMAIEGAVIAIDVIGCQLIGKRADYILARR
jgi:Transposase DDE domain